MMNMTETNGQRLFIDGLYSCVALICFLFEATSYIKGDVELLPMAVSMIIIGIALFFFWKQERLNLDPLN